MASPALGASPFAVATPVALVGSPSVAVSTPRPVPSRGPTNETAANDAALAAFRQSLHTTANDATAALALVERLQQRLLLAYSGDGGSAPADVYDELDAALASLQATLTTTGIGALDASIAAGPAELPALLERRQREDAAAATTGQRAREAAKIAADALRPR